MKDKMLKKCFLILLLGLCKFPTFGFEGEWDENPGQFPIGDELVIVYDGEGSALDSISAHLLAGDIERLTGTRPGVSTAVSRRSPSIIVGSIQSSLVRKYLPKQSSTSKELQGEWERYALNTISKGGVQHLVISGSDDRGTAFGVFEVSKRLGVSPWYWWADVPVVRDKKPVLDGLPYLSPSPSVKYRGIFLNDEDWGLQPWAEHTFEPSTGDVGPKTYAKIFELLLRLKANLIWPAMHPSTKAFFHYPKNAEMAKAYQIVVGTSHAEPMLRNNVDEWNKKERGDFNYQTNKDQVYAYWEDRVRESHGLDAYYTLGMRGIHDSGMEGVDSKEEAAHILEGIISDQRGLLQKYLDKSVEDIPQAFTAYKEVLDIYDAGLQLPEDITIVWPDDNYGYIKRLSGADEGKRKGGSGVYYHASYWGRPHDYLWLSSTHPALIREEMMKAYELGNNQLWVLNVGDIKPLEYNIQLFMDMAYQADPFRKSGETKRHFDSWHKSLFGDEIGAEAGEAMWGYYQLAFERRPEFMGWSQTEPTRPIQQTAYSHFSWGDEAQQRLAAYRKLETTVMKLKNEVPKIQFPSFYQLVYYPIRSASLMNRKFLYRDKALLYAKEQRLSALDYKEKSHQAYREILQETNYFNKELLDGKWDKMMHMAPRNLPVYQDPEIKIQMGRKIGAVDKVGVSPEKSTSVQLDGELPFFNSWTQKSHFFDLYLKTSDEVSWQAKTSDDWIRLSKQSGRLNPENGKSEARIWVDVDWGKLDATSAGEVKLSAGDQDFVIKVSAEKRPVSEALPDFVEDNRLVVIYAEHYAEKSAKNPRTWEVVEGLGHSGKVMQAKPFGAHFEEGLVIEKEMPSLTYEFQTYHHADKAELILTALPTHPITHHDGVRLAVSIDGGPIEIIDFKTKGRSEEWKQNVLSNKTSKKIATGELKPGKHSIKVFMIDPGVMLDYLYVNLGGFEESVSVLPETTLDK